MHKRMNICIAAHVDAGKTTLTEQILYHCQAIRQPGSVDKGTAHTDFLEVERRRGISVRAASIGFRYKEADINLIDTPGHMDFAAEVERSLMITDVVIFLLSAVEGIQAQTKAIWKALGQLGKPIIFFINKVDRIGADARRVYEELCTQFTSRALWAEGISWPSDSTAVPNLPVELMEGLAETDDKLLEKYLQDALSPAEAYQVLCRQFASGQLYPVLIGAALQDQGVDGLLALLTALYPGTPGDPEAEPSGLVYRIEHDKLLGRLAHVRLYAGTLKNRDVLLNVTQNTQEKITQIRKPHLNKVSEAGVLEAGDIGILCGLSKARLGDVLGNPGPVPQPVRMAEPLMMVRVAPDKEADYPQLVEALSELTAEDPLLDMQWRKEERELVLNITGRIQLEILESVMTQRFGLACTFSSPSIIYKDPPRHLGVGFDAYTMPKPCWAVLKFDIRPGERGSGIVYQSIVGEMKIMHRYQNQVRQALPDALRQGPLGWQVTDAVITLVDGEHHLIHTHPLDFIVATPMAIMDGLTRTGTTLLEPMLEFQLTADESLSGKIIGEIIDMRGTFDSPVISKGQFSMEGRYPAATSIDFPIRLASLSAGKAMLTSNFCGYAPCPTELGATMPYRGVNPLDRAKYILHIRNAL